MPNPIHARCDRCGSAVEVHPPSLPPSGGRAVFHDDPVAGCQVLEFTCGPCWESRRRDWTCVHCGDTSNEFALRCRGCGRARPGLPPYRPDPYQVAKEEYWARREQEALLSEAIREFPGFPWLPRRGIRL